MEKETMLPDEELLRKGIMVTVNVSWRTDLDYPLIQKWLENFTGDALGDAKYERQLAMWLLYNFVYYNDSEVKYLCKLLLKKYLHTQLSGEAINADGIELIAKRTKFLNLGKISESGAYILYLFRQENDLPLRMFQDVSSFSSNEAIAFIDDVTLSGNQALRGISRVKYYGATLNDGDLSNNFYNNLMQRKNENELFSLILRKINCDKRSIEKIKQCINERIIKDHCFFEKNREKIDVNLFPAAAKNLFELYKDKESVAFKYVAERINRLVLETYFPEDVRTGSENYTLDKWYLLTLVASEKAIRKLEANGVRVISCITLDDTAQAFSETSLIFDKYPRAKEDCKKMCQYYGNRIKPEYPLGYDDQQQLFGFYYSVPNDTLPIFWANKNWNPLFMRHEKNYSGDVKNVFGRFI